MSEARPFLAFLKAPTPTQSLHSTLPAVALRNAPSLWSPRLVPAPEPESQDEPEPEPVSYAPAIDRDAIRAEACELARAEGVRELASLRATLAAALVSLDTARRAIAAPSGDLIAEAASAVVAAWTSGDHRERFAPIIQRWIARDRGPAVVRIHPDDVAAMRAAIGNAALAVEPDAAIKPGDAQISSASLEVSPRWEAWLRDLRETIAAELG